MKNVAALIALASVILPAGSALIELSGVTVPTVLSFETGLGLFVAAFAVMIFVATYGGPRSIDVRLGSARPVLLPAREAFRGVDAPANISRSGTRPSVVCC